MSLTNLICKVVGHNWWEVENTVESKGQPLTLIGQTFEVYTVNKIVCRRCGIVVRV